MVASRAGAGKIQDEFRTFCTKEVRKCLKDDGACPKNTGANIKELSKPKLIKLEQENDDSIGLQPTE